MQTIDFQYIKDTAGKNLVVLSQNKFNSIIKRLEDLEDVYLYDQALKDDESPILFSDYLKQRQEKNG